jgi:hypothetical protein
MNYNDIDEILTIAVSDGYTNTLTMIRLNEIHFPTLLLYINIIYLIYLI